jgi:hypothetical protein
MISTLAERRIRALPAPKPIGQDDRLPDSGWDETQLLAYMARLDQAIGGLERKTLEDEFYYGAACDQMYERLGGRWTKWADENNVPRETFRRRRLVFLKTGKDVSKLGKYTSKMDCYWDLGIYRRSPATPDSKEKSVRMPEPGVVSVCEQREGRDDVRGDRPEQLRRAAAEAGDAPERDERVRGDGGGLELVDEIEESRSGEPEREVSIRLMASTATLIELMGEQEGFDARALIFAAVRDYAANHLRRKTWEKHRLGKSRRPASALIAG